MSAVSVSESGVWPILADAVDLARRALLALEPAAVGAHLGVTAEGESAATHRFEATLSGYRGWQWAVVVAAPPGADHATVSESALLPGPDALVAPEFVPWEQRVRPGDLAPGDLLAPRADDPRLVPGYVATGDPVVDEVACEVGLGRSKVMSREGRAEAAERWYAEHGPDSEMAKAAPSTCGLCGFYLPLAGSLRAAFGVCGNVMGADGHVVHVAYGCGAHSDTEIPGGGGSPLYEAYDDAAVEMIVLDPEQDEHAPGAAEEESPGAAPARGDGSAGRNAAVEAMASDASALETARSAESEPSTAAAESADTESAESPVVGQSAVVGETAHTAERAADDEKPVEGGSSAIAVEADSTAAAAVVQESGSADSGNAAPVGDAVSSASHGPGSDSTSAEAAVETDSAPNGSAASDTNESAPNEAAPNESDTAGPDPVESAAETLASAIAPESAAAAASPEPGAVGTDGVPTDSAAEQADGDEPDSDTRPESPSSPRS